VINADKPQLWKHDVQESVKLYNEWFLRAAPKAYLDTRAKIVGEVEDAFECTSDMTHLEPSVIRRTPGVLRQCHLA
jgi:hypothetical protein